MAVQYWLNRGLRGPQPDSSRSRGGYHGDTTGAMAVSRSARAACTPHFAGCCRSRSSLDLPVDEASMAALEAMLAARADEIAAIIVEPLVQGAGGMRFHDASVLRTPADAAPTVTDCC